jgi:hypothetical protein
MTTRRSLIGGALAAASALRAQIITPPEGQPPLATELVKEFVSKAHADFAGIRDLVKREPRLATASRDWGAGDWETGLNAASHMGRHDIAGFLIESGARIDAPAVFMLGWEPTAKAILAAFPAAHRTPGAHGIPLLSHAILGKSPATFHLLIAAGADVNAVAFRGGTPLLAAIAVDQVEMVRVLLGKGAERSEKALELAKRRKVAEIVAMLEKA